MGRSVFDEEVRYSNFYIFFVCFVFLFMQTNVVFLLKFCINSNRVNNEKKLKDIHEGKQGCVSHMLQTCTMSQPITLLTTT